MNQKRTGVLDLGHLRDSGDSYLTCTPLSWKDVVAFSAFKLPPKKSLEGALFSSDGYRSYNQIFLICYF
jgi:hypothetical protein